jgi:hypothetical protein
MTNATVGTITQAPQGNVIKVSYKGTESEYTVDPTTPIFANATGDRGLLVPGAAVFVVWPVAAGANQERSPPQHRGEPRCWVLETVRAANSPCASQLIPSVNEESVGVAAARAPYRR